jgi:hypothetical protein
MTTRTSMDSGVIANRTRFRMSRSRSGLKRSMSRKSISPVKSNKSPSKLKMSKDLSKKKQTDESNTTSNIFDEILKNDNSLPLCFLHVELLPEIPRISTQSLDSQEKVKECHRSSSRVAFSNFKVNKKSNFRPDKNYNNHYKKRIGKDKRVKRQRKETKYHSNGYYPQSDQRKDRPFRVSKCKKTDLRNYEYDESSH